MLHEYIPDYAPEMTILFSFVPGEPATAHCPGMPDYVGIDDVLIHGHELSGWVLEQLLYKNEVAWRHEILAMRERRTA